MPTWLQACSCASGASLRWSDASRALDQAQTRAEVSYGRLVPISLIVPASDAHKRFVAFATAAERVREDMVGSAEASAAERRRLADALLGWHREGLDLIEATLKPGAHAVSLRQALRAPGKEENFLNYARQLQDAVEPGKDPTLRIFLSTTRPYVVEFIGAVVDAVQEILAAIEQVTESEHERPARPDPIEHKLPRMEVKCGEKLGSGAFGTVWQATDQLLDREIAVKFLTSTNEFMDEAALLREARSLARISHHNLVVVHAAAWLRHPVTGLVQPAIVMELLVSEVLLKWRERQHARNEVLMGAMGILRGIQAMHDAGLHHSDLHPKNVIVLTSGAPKLIDWRYQDTFLERPTEHRIDLIEAEQRRTIDLVVTLLEKQGLRDDSLRIRGQSAVRHVLELVEEMRHSEEDTANAARASELQILLLKLLTTKGGGGYNLLKLALELQVKPSQVRPLVEGLYRAGEIELLTLNDDDVVYRLPRRAAAQPQPRQVPVPPPRVVV